MDLHLSFPTYIAFFLVVTSLVVFDHVSRNKAPKDAPYLSLPRHWLTGLPMNYGEYMATGYSTCKDSMFSVPTDSGPLLILPQKWINFIKVLPDTACSFRSAFKFWFLNEHTRVGGDDAHQTALNNAARRHLTKFADLEKLLAGAKEELDYALQAELPAVCEDWTKLAIYPQIIRIIARLIARVFVGPELCRDEAYLDVSVTFAVNCLMVSRILAWCPLVLRPAIKYIVPGYLSMRRQERRMQRLLAPIIERRCQKAVWDEKDRPNDLLQWFIDGASDEQKRDPTFLALSQINASLAAIHSTAIVATNAVFDLATRPQFVPPLQEELATLNDASGTPVLDMRLLSLPRLDSFLKESTRLHPLGLIGLLRMSEAEIILPDGARIPPRSQFSFAIHGMGTDETLWKDAERFDAFRFAELASQVADPKMNNWQFVTSNERSYQFGAGVHLCPGRLFAAMELKVLLATLFTRYELRSESAMEYQSGVRGLMFIPDPEKLLSIRRRA